MLLRIILMLSILLLTTNVYADPDNPFEVNAHIPSLSLTYPTPYEIEYYGMPEYSIVNQVTMSDWSHVPGAKRLKVVGIQELLLTQIRRRIEHQAQNTLRIEYNLSNMQPSEFDSRMAAINRQFNPYGIWWDRSWIHSLPPEKGGAPKIPIIQEIGWDIRITRNTPIVGWIKKQFDKLGDIWIDTNKDFDEERGPNPTRYDGIIENDIKNYAQLNQIVEANIGIDKPWRWFESDFYHFRFKPIIKFKLSNPTLVDEVALQVQTELFTNNKTKHFATLSFFIRHNIPDKTTFFSIFIALVNF